MDKTDVEMEDAATQPEEELDNVKGSEDVILDDEKLKLDQGQQLPSPPVMSDDLKSSSQIEDQDHNKMSSEIDSGNTQHPVDSLMEEQSDNVKIQLQDQDNAPLHNEDARSNSSKSHEIELEDQNRPKSPDKEEENNKAMGEAEQQNMAKSEGEDNPIAEAQTEAKDQVDFVNAAKEQNSSENSKEVEDTLDSTMEEKLASENAEEEVAKTHSHNGQLPFQLPVSEVPPKKKEALGDVHQSESEEMVKVALEEVHQSETGGLVNGRKEPENKSVLPATITHDKTVTKTTEPEVVDSPFGSKRQPATPDFPLKYSSKRSGGHSGETFKIVLNNAKMAENDDGTPEEQAAFIKELENFYRQRSVEFKPPKFYGQPLNCYKLWTAVIKLGGYDLVTGTKLWRQVGESFHPPKTCTTVSWTFRIFYEKSLLDYERYKVQNGDVELPAAALPEASGVDNEGNGYQASGSGRARRDAAARAMQGWHAQRLFGYGEDKTPNNMQKRENKLKSIGSLKQKRPTEVELPVKAQRTETYKQLVTTVVDVGPAADWVKINVRETKDCFEVYALVPGLLREEVRVQSDPAGRLVITGQPEQADNPWGITAFKKVVNLPARIDPLQTSAVVSLHGRLFVRVPFEQSNM